MTVQTDKYAVGASGTASQKFTLTAPNNGTFKLGRGVLGAESSFPFVVNADDSISGNMGIGAGQTRQTVTRTSGTTYTNSTGKTIQWNFSQLGGVTCTTTIGGVVVAFVATPAGGLFAHSFIIPNGSTYGYTCTLTSDHTELR